MTTQKRWESYVTEAQRYQKWIDEETPSLEKFLREARYGIQERLLKQKKKIERMEKDLAQTRSDIEEGDKFQLEIQQERYDILNESMQEIARILSMPEYRIEVDPATGKEAPITQQTHSDKKLEIANELTHLPIGRAKVRLRTAEGIKEHVIATYRPIDIESKLNGGKPLDTKAQKQFHEERARRLRENKPAIIAQTRRLYCKTREAVEEEIQRRQSGSDEPPPTKRRG
jgi:hypothetical protein